MATRGRLMPELPSCLSVRGDDLLLRVKAVPGSRRDEVAGLLGDRLKVRVAAPPENGRANAAIRELLATHFEIDARMIDLEQGAAAAAKTFVLRSGARCAERIGAMLSR